LCCHEEQEDDRYDSGDEWSRWLEYAEALPLLGPLARLVTFERAFRR
jgi:hypothetical protein